MNILFVSHCDFTGNSAMHIFSIANHLAALGMHCAVCIPGKTDTVFSHGAPRFQVLDFQAAMKEDILFPDNRGPDVIHAWTPRELVRKVVQRLAARCQCRYVVHLEDNEEVILENELPDKSLKSLTRLPSAHVDLVVPEHRTHPMYWKEFLSNAAGMTVLMDRLLEFKPEDVPGVVFWPGYDEEPGSPPCAGSELRQRLGIGRNEHVIVYTGNVHASNLKEVRSLFLAAALLRRKGHLVKVIKTGWNYADLFGTDFSLLKEHAVDLGFLPRKEIPALISLADVLVQPGGPNRFNDYRFPSKLPEYFASGKPVVLPRTNIGRFILDGVEGVLLEKGDALEIAEKVQPLLVDQELRKRIGEAGRRFALRNLQWSHNVKIIKEFYEQLMESEWKAPVPGHMNETQVCRGSQTEEKLPSSLDPSRGVEELQRVIPPKLIAFYLPQFHPIPENDAWWGKGFTEWTNVVRAKPLFPGHYQPHLPRDLGFYDLRAPEVMEQQAELARAYGISGFCFYYYWFGGWRLLDRPLMNLLKNDTFTFPFCICWANESWTRAWDGLEQEILMKQEYSFKFDTWFIRDLIPIMKDPRYLRIEGKPVLLVYRINALPDPAATARIWREVCAGEGIPSIHLCAVQSFGITDPRPYGFDAAVEFPPHTERALMDSKKIPGLHPEFEGYIEDYIEVARRQITQPPADYIRYRGVMPSWDNTARRGLRAHICRHSSPSAYEGWLQALVAQTLARSAGQESLIFINAWNEWAEGNHLEPDEKHGHAYLEATRRALCRGTELFLSESVSAGASGGARPSFHVHFDGTKIAVNQKEEGAAAAKPPATRASKTSGWFDEAALQAIARRYQNGVFSVEPLSYGTVRDFCDSIDNLRPLAKENKDIKDCQRPWMLKAVLAAVPTGGRLLEIGAGEPFVADILSRLGYEVWIVDPYDGSANGPLEYAQFREECPDVHFVRDLFTDTVARLDGQSFDCIYSISVLEHVPAHAQDSFFAGLRKFLKPEGVTIHVVDHVHRGNGAAAHLDNLKRMIVKFGFSIEDLEHLLKTMEADTDTCYLSAEGHNIWRGNLPYDEFPMRVCVSIQICALARSLRPSAQMGSAQRLRRDEERKRK